MEMEGVLLVSSAMRVAFGAFALIGAKYVMRHFDRAAGIDFKRDVWDKIAESPSALALYHGLQFLAVAHLLGMALS